MSVFFFVLTTLAVWRITHLLAKEDGPFDIIFLIRKKTGSGFFGRLLDCFYCVSIWVALPFGLLQHVSLPMKLLYWAALSGGACILEQATISKKSNKDEIPDFKED